MNYAAKSASAKTDDWPFWFVADEAGLNITVRLMPELRGYMPFVPREAAEELARKANGAVQ
jgi:hypothetical protein